MTTPYRDPAERSGSLRRFYRDWRPTRLGRLVNGAWAWLSGLGLTPRVLLTLRGFGFLQRLPRRPLRRVPGRALPAGARRTRALIHRLGHARRADNH